MQAKSAAIAAQFNNGINLSAPFYGDMKLYFESAQGQLPMQYPEGHPTNLKSKDGGGHIARWEKRNTGEIGYILGDSARPD